MIHSQQAVITMQSTEQAALLQQISEKLQKGEKIDSNNSPDIRLNDVFVKTGERYVEPTADAEKNSAGIGNEVMYTITSMKHAVRVPPTTAFKKIETGDVTSLNAEDGVDIGVAMDLMNRRGLYVENDIVYDSRPVVEKAWEVDFNRAPSESPSSSYRMAPVVTRKGTVIVSRGRELLGYDGKNGGVRWRLECKDDLCTRPVVSEHGTVYAASFDGRLYAVDGDTGEKRWSRTWNQYMKSAKDWVTDHLNYNGVGDFRQWGTYPALSIGPDGTVYGSSDHRVFAFSEKGSRKFNALHGGGLSSILSTPAAGPSGLVHVVIAKLDEYRHPANYLLGMDGQTGKEVWSKSMYNDIDNPVLTCDKSGNILIGEEYGLMSYNGDSGERNFTYGSDYTHRIPVPPRIGRDGTHYIVSGRGFDLMGGGEGKKTWTVFFQKGFRATPAEGPDGLIYAVGIDGTGCAIRKEDGKVMATFACDRGAYGAIEITSDGVLIVSDERGISAYNLPKVRLGTSEEMTKQEDERRAGSAKIESSDEYVVIDGVKLKVKDRNLIPAA